MTFILKDLPKISLNEWYAGKHWTVRKRIKDNYAWIIKSQFRHVFPKDRKYACTYDFYFKTRPLDVSNVVSMLKLIEDIIFEDDRYDIIPHLSISSQKATSDYVQINVIEIVD